MNQAETSIAQPQTLDETSLALAKFVGGYLAQDQRPHGEQQPPDQSRIDNTSPVNAYYPTITNAFFLPMDLEPTQRPRQLPSIGHGRP